VPTVSQTVVSFCPDTRDGRDSFLRSLVAANESIACVYARQALLQLVRKGSAQDASDDTGAATVLDALQAAAAESLDMGLPVTQLEGRAQQQPASAAERSSQTLRALLEREPNSGALYVKLVEGCMQLCQKQARLCSILPQDQAEGPVRCGVPGARGLVVTVYNSRAGGSSSGEPRSLALFGDAKCTQLLRRCLVSKTGSVVLPMEEVWMTCSGGPVDVLVSPVHWGFSLALWMVENRMVKPPMPATPSAADTAAASAGAAPPSKAIGFGKLVETNLRALCCAAVPAPMRQVLTSMTIELLRTAESDEWRASVSSQLNELRAEMQALGQRFQSEKLQPRLIQCLFELLWALRALPDDKPQAKALAAAAAWVDEAGRRSLLPSPPAELSPQLAISPATDFVWTGAHDALLVDVVQYLAEEAGTQPSAMEADDNNAELATALMADRSHQVRLCYARASAEACVLPRRAHHRPRADAHCDGAHR
jgi:hypothetical protein